MLRFIIRRKLNDRYSGLQSEGLETLDAACPELEAALMGGGTGQESYDVRQVIDAEVLPPQPKATPAAVAEFAASESWPHFIGALRNQRQVDEDGTDCGVSRQAVDKAIELLEALGGSTAAAGVREGGNAA